MKIEIKPIIKKENEWKPQTSVQQYFSLEKVNKIIDEEKLKDDMICIQNVSFNSITQTFSNVVIASEKYNGEFIFLVKTENIIKNRNYFFAYITQKSWNTGLKIVLDLTIDPITSNLDLFNDNKLAGEVYIERTNNYLRCVNDTHSDVCVSIINRKEEYNLTNIEIDKEIDIFVEKTVPNAIEKQLYQWNGNILPGTHLGTLTIHPKGNLIVDAQLNPRILGAKTFQNIKTILPTTDKLPNKTLKNVFDEYTSARLSNFNDADWYFGSNSDADKFVTEIIQLYPIFKEGKNTRFNYQKILSVIDTDVFEDKTTRWITIPKIFKYQREQLKDDIVALFEIDLTENLKKYNQKNHLFMHYNYFLIWNRVFKIPINIIKNSGKIYGIREIVNEGVKFSFFNDYMKTDLFFEQTFSLQNALLSDDYAKFEKDLLISRNAGAINNQGSIFGETLLNQILNASSTFLLGTLASGGNPLIGTATAVGTGAVGIVGGAISVPFNKWKENKQLKYEQMKIQNANKTPKAEVSLNSLFKMFESNNVIFSWAWLSYSNNVTVQTPDGKSAKTDKGYCIFDKNKIGLPNYERKLALIIEQPLQCDIDKINLDQKQYGNIVNEFKINDNEYQNPLIFNEHTNDFLFWQGKINPKINPIDNFQLDFLNETLARGVKIIKILKYQ